MPLYSEITTVYPSSGLNISKRKKKAPLSHEPHWKFFTGHRATEQIQSVPPMLKLMFAAALKISLLKGHGTALSEMS